MDDRDRLALHVVGKNGPAWRGGWIPAATGRRSVEGFGEDVQRVFESGEQPGWQHGCIPEFLQPAGEHHEAADQIAAVDR
jgi:hypothetical protein